MRKLAAMLLIALPPALGASAGAAPTPGPPNHPDIVVTGDDRIVCRYVIRTATRVRVGRICRRLSEWRADPDPAARAVYDANATIDGAADTLEVLGQRVGVRSEGSLGPR